MEKTISINLNNQNFLIEEEAYQKLAAYLENIKLHCGEGVDAAEVISDIENSMAEKLKSSLAPYKEVITIKDVESLIKIMGTVEDFDREVGGVSSEKKSEETKEEKTKRKLYRDTDNAVIGGVAAGLANYFDADPVLFRIIFCILLIAGGSAIPIYILLWIAMPEAKSAHQKLEMQGQAPTLAAFKNLTKTGKQIKKNVLSSNIHQGLIMIVNFIKLCFGLGVVIFSFIGLGIISVGSLFLLLNNNSTYQLSFIPISELTSLMPYTWMVIAGFLSLAIPTALLLIGGLAIIIKKNIINFTTSLILVGIWMIAGIFFCTLCLRYFPEVQNKYQNYPLLADVKTVVDMSGINEIDAKGRLIDITVSASTSTPASLNGRKVDLDNITMVREGNKLIITGEPVRDNRKICFDCDLRSIELTVATSSNLIIKADNGASVYDETKIEETVIEPEIK